jgi:flagellin
VISLSSTYIFSKGSDHDLARVAAQHSKSLNRLSSGVKTSDPLSQGGEAGLDFKYRNTSITQKSVETGMLNAISFLEAQAGAFQHISDSLERMGELVVLMKDVTKNSTDLDNYMLEFDQVRTEINATRQQQFNGLDLMYSTTPVVTPDPLTVMLNERGDETMTITQSDFDTFTYWDQVFGTTISTPATVADLTVPGVGSLITTADQVIDEVGALGFGVTGLSTLQEDLAARMAQNGAELSRLRVSLDHIRQRSVDYDHAGSRIFDTDVAQEVTTLARKDILLQGLAASRVQSNVLSEVALRVMGG